MSEENLSGALEKFATVFMGRPKAEAMATAVAAQSVLVMPGPPLVGYENIVGVAIEEKITGGKPAAKLCLKVYVVKKLPESYVLSESQIPKQFDSIDTDVEEIGEIYAQEDPACYDPAQPGSSIGHVSITFGTFGCVVRGPNKKEFILSNNHVLANSNNAGVGDFAVQPGPRHGGRHAAGHPSPTCGKEDKCIGSLADFEPIDFAGGLHRIDAAIAEPIERGRRLDPNIIAIGGVNGTIQAAINMKVKKRGARTELTNGKIRSTTALIDVNYGTPLNPIYGRFTGQIAIEGTPPPFSMGGDSGSLIVDSNNKAVGLLYAGNAFRTFANPIGLVLQRFNAAIV